MFGPHTRALLGLALISLFSTNVGYVTHGQVMHQDVRLDDQIHGRVLDTRDRGVFWAFWTNKLELCLRSKGASTFSVWARVRVSWRSPCKEGCPAALALAP